MTEAVEHTVVLLRRRRRGLAAVQLYSEVTRISPAHASWSREMCRSALTSDARFHFSQAGAMELSTWATVRVPSRSEIIQRCLDASGGRALVATVQQQIEAIYGEAPDRASVGSTAYYLGARLRGEWLERPSSKG